MDKKLIILGVGHVFDIEERIEEIISEEKPDAIALELDEERASVIEGKDNDNKRFVFSFYYFLSKYQENIAKKLGREVGKEMVAAMKIAKSRNIPVFYIDKKSYEVIAKLWNELSLKEKILFLSSLFLSLFRSRKEIEKELNEIKDKADEIIDEIGKKFPKIKRILVDERDEHMAYSLMNLSEKYNKILAIVGEGHISGISRIIGDKLNSEIIHLKEII
ncbi:MAG: TraB/GumN family protein [Thermoplasmatales archaeon]|nr:TraB/GumN family protein [Thermoplasmatales archaeon]